MLVEAAKGSEFLKRHRLTGRNPRWANAVAEINQFSAGQFPTNPSVTIVVPVFGQLAYTLNCIHSLLPDIEAGNVELIVADDGSPDNSVKWLKQLKGVTLLETTKNQGFLKNCNVAVEAARGEYIVLLNNDTRVVPGWLDGLIATFKNNTEAGLVGAKLFYPDGSLQEAGGIVWKDGSAWNYGRGDDPNRPRYCHMREVDYVSGCAIALRRTLWNELGGFDIRFAPAYYEDTDLAFRVRQKGLKVLFQPLSRVIHYEGKTSGTDLTTGIKAYQVTNGETFRRLWARELEAHRDNGEEPWLERNRSFKRCVLVLDTVTPTPNQDAGSAATVSLLKAYQNLGFHVVFVPEDNFLYDKAYTSELQANGVECLYAPYETSLTDIIERYGAYLSVVQLIRPGTAARAWALVKSLLPSVPLFYLNADLHFLRLERQALLHRDERLMDEARQMKTLELDLLNKMDVTFVHSTAEKTLLNSLNSSAFVDVMPLVASVVDAPSPFTHRRDVMFLGGFNHPPNVDAADWLVSKIWPTVKSQMPGARLLIVGPNPPEQLTSISGDDVIVTGHVEDLESCFQTVRVFIAPLRFGAGAKGKIVTALAQGIPVIATSIAVEGMGLTAGLDVEVADDAEGLSEKLLQAYNSTAKQWERRSQNGQRIILERHSHSEVVKVLSRALKLRVQGVRR